MEGQRLPPQRSHSSSFSSGFSRRYACDRCRGHKLRCDRDVATTTLNPCYRCIKAKAQCVISSTFRNNHQEKVNRRTLSDKSNQTSRISDSPKENENGHRPENSSIDNTQQTNQPDVLRSATSSMGSADLDQHQSAQHQELDASFDFQGDSLQLLSVPWMDIMDVNMRDGHDLDCEDDTGGQGSSSMSALSTSELATFDFDSNVIGQTYPYPLPSDDLPRGQIDQGPAESHNLVPAPKLAQKGPERSTGNQRKPIRNSQNSGNKPSPKSNKVARYQPQGTGQISQATTTPRPTTIELKEACMNRLSELSIHLMKDLDLLISCKLASSFLFTPAGKNTAEYLFKTSDGTTSQDNAIGRVLHGTEQFLDILEDCKACLRAPSTAPLQEPVSATDLEDFQSFCDTGQQTLDESTVLARWEVLQSYLGRSRPLVLTPESSADSELSRPPSSFSSSQSRPQPRIDIPFTLAILNCYTCLLKIFETVFSAVNRTLGYMLAPGPALAAELPPTVPGLQINGFQLNNYRSLQIKILIQVSSHMLDTLERCLEFDRQDSHGRSGFLANPLFKELLQVVLKQEGLDCSEGNLTGMKKVRGLLQKMGDDLKNAKL